MVSTFFESHVKSIIPDSLNVLLDRPVHYKPERHIIGAEDRLTLKEDLDMDLIYELFQNSGFNSLNLPIFKIVLVLGLVIFVLGLVLVLVLVLVLGLVLTCLFKKDVNLVITAGLLMGF